MSLPLLSAKALTGFTDPASWQTIATDHNQNFLRLLSTRDRSDLIDLLPKLHPTLLQLSGQPAVDAALEPCATPATSGRKPLTHQPISPTDYNQRLQTALTLPPDLRTQLA